MAEGIFRKIASERHLKVEVLSAGIFAKSGTKSPVAAVDAAREKGINMNHHRSRLLERKILEDADLILTMTKGHKDHILEIMPEIFDRIFTLKEYVSGEGCDDIIDLAGADLESFRACANEIETELKLLFENNKL